MRLRIAVASAVLLVACSAFAQQANRLSVYLTNPAASSTKWNPFGEGQLRSDGAFLMV